MFDLTPKHNFLVGVDSDGCVFDTMELKQKECFTPNVIKYFGLQGVSKYAREACDFVNLYSKSRGINRFPALVEELDWLARRPEVRARGVKVELAPAVRKWVAEEPKPGNPALEKAVAAKNGSGDKSLEHLLEWSKAVNRSVEEMVSGVPPFPCVRESFKKLLTQADILVVSATPNEALEREWDEHDLTSYVVAICGQEAGTKKECLAVASKYSADHTLMIGDAPGDFKAAQANKALFYPINPGAEETSWRRFLEEGIERFLCGSFAGAYQQELLDEFDRYLPSTPPWPVV